VKITSASSARDQVRLSWRKYRSWVLVGVTFAVHLLIAARSVGPMYVFDEVGYLANANVMAGHGADWSLCGSSYAVGYSVVLAPLWWLPITPTNIYQIAVLFSAALGALAMWPAAALARRFGARGDVALAIGALVTLIPARALMDNYVLAENPLTLLVLCCAIVALRLAQVGRRSDAILLGTLAGLAAATHARAVPLVCVTLVWLAARAIVKRTSWLDVAFAAVPALAITFASLAAQAAVGSRVFADDSRVADLVGHLTPLGVVDVVLGQAFTQVVSWSLLTALGLLACAGRARASLRADGVAGVGAAWWWLGGMVAAQAAFFVWVLASSADLGSRFDIPIFGRYLDPFVVPVAVLGAVRLWVKLSTKLATVALVASISAVLAYGVVVLPRITLDQVWIPFAIPGLVPFLDVNTGDDRPFLALAGLVAILGCVLLWLSRGRARVGLLAALVVAIAVTFGADWFRVDPLEADSRAETTTGAFVLVNPEHSVTMAADLLPCLERNRIQFETAGHITIVPANGDYGHDIVVGPKTWPEIEREGFSKQLFTTFLEAAAWVYQG
jgi:hypothetical protein